MNRQTEPRPKVRSMFTLPLLAFKKFDLRQSVSISNPLSTRRVEIPPSTPKVLAKSAPICLLVWAPRCPALTTYPVSVLTTELLGKSHFFAWAFAFLKAAPLVASSLNFTALNCIASLPKVFMTVNGTWNLEVIHLGASKTVERAGPTLSGRVPLPVALFKKLP